MSGSALCNCIQVISLLVCEISTDFVYEHVGWKLTNTNKGLETFCCLSIDTQVNMQYSTVFCM